MYPKAEDPMLSLSTVKRIGLLGDTHADLDHVLIVAKTMWARGVSTLVVLGDFGFVWPGHSDLDKLNRRLDSLGQTLLFVDGNHEDFERLYSFPIGDDELRWVRPNIAHIPRGFRATLASGKTLAALGGANSVDVGNRTEGHSWWPEESITDQDLVALGREHVDILIGHDAPNPLPALDAQLTETDHSWPEAGRQYSAAGRQKFTEGFLQVHPTLYLGGHYHQHIDEHFAYGALGDVFETRVALLDMNGSTDAISQAILDVRTLKLDFFARTDTTVTELTGREEGRWRVTTIGSSHILDFNRWSATRIPGEGASVTFNDRERPLITIRACRVGESGYWTMAPDGGWSDSVDHYWHQTSEIRSIARITDTPPPGNSDPDSTTGETA